MNLNRSVERNVKYEKKSNRKSRDNRDYESEPKIHQTYKRRDKYKSWQNFYEED